jgi:heme/copper-type cytochrome/quinol oxidase subunit 1
MRLIDRLSKAQRIVVVVALGMAFVAVGGYLVSLGGAPRFGWYAYAPLAGSLQGPRTGLPAWLRLIIWLGLIALWTLASVRVLRPSPKESAPR